MLNFIQSLNHWQIDLLATGLLLQGAVFAVFPEDVIILTLGVLWGQGRLTFPEALISVQFGLLPANLAMVLIGKFLGKNKFLKRRGVRNALDYLHRYGGRLIFVTRFTPLVRAPVYLAVGGSGFPVLSFIRIDAWASCFQISLLLLLGRWISTHSGSITEAYRRLGVFSGSALFLVLVTMLIQRRFQKSEPSSTGEPLALLTP